MSTSIICYENDPTMMIYCKSSSAPANIGFYLLDNDNSPQALLSDPERFEKVSSYPEDIQYEYIIKNDGTIHCQECWYTKDKSYHGGGFRHGGVYDLVEWKEKVRLQELYSYRRPEAWENQ